MGFRELVAYEGEDKEEKLPKMTSTQAPFPLTPEFYDANLMDSDATWPTDPAVPELPPLPATDDPEPPVDNFLNVRFWDGLHAPKEGPPTPRPRTRPVTSEDPLKVDVIYSHRSPYSYLVTQRLVWLHSNYNVDVNVRLVLPVAVRSTKGGTGKAGGAFARFYFLPHAQWDGVVVGRFQGVPHKHPVPDPVWQNLWPPGDERFMLVHPPEKQPYISWIVRLGCYAQLKGKSIDHVHQIQTLIWGDQVAHWPAHVKERFNRIDGLDYDEAISYIRENTDEIDAVWQENSRVQLQAGHGGVPLMIINGEPFFGSDRFDHFFSRLRENGLTERQTPRPPFTTKPRRWPDGM
jgi:2-hydroxychromene-2-carboxylate isomerase